MGDGNTRYGYWCGVTYCRDVFGYFGLFLEPGLACSVLAICIFSMIGAIWVAKPVKTASHIDHQIGPFRALIFQNIRRKHGFAQGSVVVSSTGLCRW